MSRPLRVLFGEDREDDALLVQRDLQRAGYALECHRVETRAQMQDQLRGAEWDLVISDYSMPQFDAVDALRVLKESGLDLPFIIVSGTVSEEVAVAALKSGAHDFIPKGNLKRLAPAVAREMREAQSRRERRRAEEELRVTTETLSAAFAASPVPMLLLDTSGKALRWNEAAERVFGWSAEEVLGRRLPIIPEAEVDDFQQQIEAVLRGRRISNREIVRVRKDGGRVRVLVSAAAVTDAGGKARAVMGILVDVTEQRALEEQFRQAQKMEAVGRLAGGIAHDFNNVLTAIQGYATLLLADLPPDDPHREDAAEIVAAAERAASFTRQLLTFSRKQVMKPESLEINAVVHDLTKMLARMIGGHIELRIATSQEPLWVLADQGQLQQVLVNLVVNARDAMRDPGCITVRTGRATVAIEDAANQHVVPGSFVVIEVTDSGAGIPNELLEFIFEPFFTTKEAGKGTGLGLSTVYGIVRQNRGFVRVDSKVGAGSTFSVFLPENVPAGAVSEPAPLASTPRMAETASVLVVEDQESIRNLIGRILARSSYDARFTATPGEALAVLDSNGSLDLLLADVMLPGMSGVELANLARQRQPHLSIVLMSGYSEEELAMGNGYTYLEKPFTPSALLSTLAEAMSQA